MKTGYLRFLVQIMLVCILLLPSGGCQKQQMTQSTVSPCNDYNNRKVVQETYDETEATEYGQYTAGYMCTYSWKVSASSACENGPLDLNATVTLASDTNIKVSMGYIFQRAKQEKMLSLKYSSPYEVTVNNKETMVEDIYNAESSVNNCTTCQGSLPSPVDLFLRISFPSTGYSDQDRAKLRTIIKAISLKMNYVYSGS